MEGGDVEVAGDNARDSTWEDWVDDGLASLNLQSDSRLTASSWSFDAGLTQHAQLETLLHCGCGVANWVWLHWQLALTLLAEGVQAGLSPRVGSAAGLRLAMLAPLRGQRPAVLHPSAGDEQAVRTLTMSIADTLLGTEAHLWPCPSGQPSCHAQILCVVNTGDLNFTKARKSPNAFKAFNRYPQGFPTSKYVTQAARSQ